MKAITFAGVEHLELLEVADPVLTEATDAIVEVEVAGICGSDLHPYLGREKGLDVGTVMGHEFIGRVVAVGSAVTAHKVGARVVSPFSTNCGECWACNAGLTSRCVRGQLFGWVEKGRGLHGGQAELVRVPLADSTLVAVPDEATDLAAVMLAGDVLATAMFGAELAGVSDGDTVVVVGCGPVGLLAIRAALARGAARVFAIDAVASRLALARDFGASALSFKDGNVEAGIREATDGRGADRAIEAVGSSAATLTAANSLRPGATIAAIGVHTEPYLALSPGELYDRNLSYSAGRCAARRMMPQAIPLAIKETALLSRLITHRVPITGAIAAYQSLAAREEGWGKVVIE